MPKTATQKGSDADVKVKAAGKAAAVKAPAPVVTADNVTPEAPVKTTEKKTKASGKADKSAAKPAAAEKTKKLKMIRDSFTMPEAEYKVLSEVKRACLQAGIEVKKSELLRVGVELIRQTEVGTLQNILSTLTPLKAGRPKKEK